MSIPSVDEELLHGLQQLGRLMASRRVAARLSDAAGTRLTQQEMRVLRSLHRVERLSVAALAARCSMDLGAVSRQLKELEARGLVRRSVPAEDQRVALVELTEAGTRVADRLRAVGVGHLELALSSWSESDRRLAAQLLTRLVGDLQRTAVDAGPGTEQRPHDRPHHRSPRGAT